MSAEAEYVDSVVELIDASPKRAASQSESESESPKRQKVDEDSSVCSEDLPSTHASDGDDESAASSNDKPPTESEGSAADESPDQAYEDEELRETLARGLSNLKALLTRNKKHFAMPYIFYSTSGEDGKELQEEFIQWAIENLIAFDKMEEKAKGESVEEEKDADAKSE